MSTPRQAGHLVNGGSVPRSGSGCSELIGEHSFSVRDQVPPKGAHDFDKAPLQPKMALASDRIFGDMRVADAFTSPALPGHRAALLGRSSCFWGSNSSISAELRLSRGKLIWADLTRISGRTKWLVL
jgi:hypothetical protein